MNKIFEKLKAINWKSKKAVICCIIAGAVIVSGGIGTYFAIDNYKTQQVIAQAEKDTQTKADEMTNKISKLDYNKITLEDEKTIKDLLAAYNELDENTKSKVANFEVLKNCEERIQTLKIEQEEKAKAEQQAKEEEKQRQEKEASRISAEIDKIPQSISLAYENTINILKSEYNALSDEAKALVINWNRIAELEQQINQLKQNNISNNNGNTSNNNNSSYNNNNSSGGNTASSNGGSSSNNGGNTSNNGSSNSGNNNGGTPSTPTPQPPQRTWEYMPSLSRQTFDLMNAFRQQNGVPALSWNETCNSRAKSQAEYNASTNTYGHGAGQISLGNGTANPQAYINQWASSAGHRESMLDTSFTGGAVAVYKDSNGNYYVVTDFYDDFWG